jgi:hypothetical protein
MPYIEERARLRLRKTHSHLADSSFYSPPGAHIPSPTSPTEYLQWESNTFIFFPKRPPANKLFCTKAETLNHDEIIYSTLNTLAPFLLVDLFFLCPLSKDTALW